MLEYNGLLTKSPQSLTGDLKRTLDVGVSSPANLTYGGEKLNVSHFVGTGSLCTGDAVRDRQDRQFALSHCLVSASKLHFTLFRVRRVYHLTAL